jgi:hypothetical protein
VYEAVRAARDGDGLQYELEEKLIQRASADAADAISKVVPAPFRSCLLQRRQAETHLNQLFRVQRPRATSQAICRRKNGTAKPT